MPRIKGHFSRQVNYLIEYISASCDSFKVWKRCYSNLVDYEFSSFLAEQLAQWLIDRWVTIGIDNNFIQLPCRLFENRQLSESLTIFHLKTILLPIGTAAILTNRLWGKSICQHDLDQYNWLFSNIIDRLMDQI